MCFFKALFLLLIFKSYFIECKHNCHNFNRLNTNHKISLNELNKCENNLGKKFSINFKKGFGIEKNEIILNNFLIAAEIWEDFLHDTMINDTINIFIDFKKLNYGAIGSTHSTNIITEYDSEYSIIPYPLKNKTNINFPSKDSLNFDTGNRADYKGLMIITKANLKAIGIEKLDERFGEIDGSIELNSDYPFDYNITDGIDSDKIDLLSIIIHEIGHLLGFMSGIDKIELGDPEFIPSILDIYRFEKNEIDDFLYDLRLANPSEKNHYFVFPIREEKKIIKFSRGAYTGDGFQASHWQSDDIDNEYIGIMDPSINKGRGLVITKNDMLAFRALGYLTCDYVIPRIMNIRKLNNSSLIIISHFVYSSTVICKTNTNTTYGIIEKKNNYIICNITQKDKMISISFNNEIFSDFYSFL